MKTVLLWIIAIALILSSVFFWVDEFYIPAKYEMSYYKFITELRGVSSQLALICRYVFAYPLGAVVIIMHLVKKE